MCTAELEEQLRFFYRSGVDSTSDLADDLAPAVRMALRADISEPILPDPVSGAFHERYKHLIARWEEDVAPNLDPHWQPPDSLILDAELLVYDEGSTPAGMYDELGTSVRTRKPLLRTTSRP